VILWETEQFQNKTKNRLSEMGAKELSGTAPGPILEKYCTSNGAILLVDFSYWPAEQT